MEIERNQYHVENWLALHTIDDWLVSNHTKTFMR